MTPDTLRALVERLRASGAEVLAFPHPSACDHLHDANGVMQEAATVIERFAQQMATEYDLQALMKCADEATSLAFRDPAVNGDPINWGDFACVSAETYVNEDGGRGYRVRFEEAAPECPKFHDYARKHLEKHGYRNVEVVTEW